MEHYIATSPNSETLQAAEAEMPNKPEEDL